MSDIVYYNIELFNDEPNIPLLYKNTHIVPVLNNPVEYEVAILRFDIPASKIPILIYENNTNYVKVSYKGYQVYKKLVFYRSYDLNVIPTYPDSLFSYNDLALSVNNTYETALDELQALVVAGGDTFPVCDYPKLIYRAETRTYEFKLPLEYQEFSQTSVDPIKIYMNGELYQKFSSFQSFRYPIETNPLNGEDETFFLIQCFDLGDNIKTIGSTQYLYISQEFSVLGQINDLRNIYFETSNIPITREIQGVQRDTTKSILTDFFVNPEINDKSDIIYNAEGLEARYHDLNQNTPLRNIDIKIYWSDKYGKVRPLYIQKDSAFSCKLVFRKKERYRKHTDLETVVVNYDNTKKLSDMLTSYQEKPNNLLK